MITDARRQSLALGVGVAAAAACAGGAVVWGATAFFSAYLVAFLFWTEIAFGCLGLTMLHALTSGGWGKAARRPLSAGGATLPFVALSFVPVALGVRALFPWARPEVVAGDLVLEHKALYLNVPFFVARAVGYFALWSALALFFYRSTLRRGPDRGPSRRARTFAGPGLVACGVTMSFAAIDWVMSLEPHWFSTMVGALVVVGALLSAMAFAIVVVTSDAKEHECPTQALHDLGNLLLVFTMLWAYLAFSQYLLIYAGNIAEEVPFFVYRTEGGWQHVSLALIVLHFAVPFFVLLSRRTKRNPERLRAVAVFVLLMRLVELFWFVAPNFKGTALAVGPLDLLAPIAVGGVWFYAFVRRVRALDAATPAPASRSEAP
ncbi:MAG TPA: hypothetical protein VGM56_22145 [Byssovorax sp.]